MKQGYTHICVVLDASGSMESIKKDIKGSFNGFLQKQREAEGKTVFDLFQFAGSVKRLVKSADLSLFQDDLMAKYVCCGNTALHDAICTAIDTIGQEFAAMPETERPEHVLCVIITDGAENFSHQFTLKDVQERIKRQKEVYQWEFDFLAADQDAFAAGHAMGLDRQACMSFDKSPMGAAHLSMRMCSRADAIRKKMTK